MDALVKAFQDAAQIVQDLTAMKDQITQTVDTLNARGADLNAREQKVSALESAAATLAQAKQLRDEAAKLHEDLATAQATLDNNTREALAQIAKERDSLNPLLELQKQIAADKQTLADGWAALEKEKAEYQERIRAGLLEHFKAGGR